MKKTKVQNGITLIALIITIVVLLILATVAITAIREYNIIENANSAVQNYGDQSEREHIQLKINGWEIEKYSNPGKTFIEYLKEQFGEGKVVDNGDGKYNVTLESGNTYKVQEDGNITSTKGIYIQAQGMPLTLEEGKTVTGTITATLSGIEGEIIWSNADNSVATISGTSGESITVTAVAKGETKVTASCGGYKAEYIVKVIIPVSVGVYVEYDVSYTDMYQGTQYTKTNGWRYLGIDDAGNKLLVSTAIPAIIYYQYLPGDTLPTWWATETEVQADTGIYNTTAGWNWNNGGYPSKYAAYGLRYKFESIPFTYQATGTSVSTENTGIFRKVGSITSGTNLNLNFRARGVEIEDVHNLTLAELNKATNSATGGKREETNIFSGFKELTGKAEGLFDMRDLTGYTANYNYWLSAPYTTSEYSVCRVFYNSGSISLSNSASYGVRPVVVLSDVEIVDTDGDGIYEIK